METRVQRLLDDLVVGGASAALAEFRDGDAVWRGSSGTARLGVFEPVAQRGWFRIGSVTKTFTAVAVLLFCAEGAVRLDDSVERWLPDLVPGGAEITLRQLLNHTSGLYNYTDALPGIDGIVRDRYRTWSPPEMVAVATQHGPVFAPGASWAYCNTGYVLLGMVLERVTGQPYADVLRERILRPLELDGTSLPVTPELPEPHARGYLPVAGEPVDVTEFDPSPAWSAGGLISTAADLNRFYRALLGGGVLGPEELSLMRTVIPVGTEAVATGLGLTRIQLPGGQEFWGRDGGFFGYHTWSYHSADGVRQLTVSANSIAGARPASRELLTRVFGDDGTGATAAAA